MLFEELIKVESGERFLLACALGFAEVNCDFFDIKMMVKAVICVN